MTKRRFPAHASYSTFRSARTTAIALLLVVAAVQVFLVHSVSAAELDVKLDYDLAKAPVKTIYVTFSSHWDLEFTDPDDIERDQLVWLIDNLIDTAQAHADFRWHIEATWHIDAWLRSNPPPERRDALFAAIRKGQISLGATQQMINGLPEEIAGRIAYEAADLADRYQLKPPETAIAADYVGYSWGLVQPLVRSGVKYLLNSHHPFFIPHDRITRKDQPFWWEGPDGSRLLVWRMEYTSAIHPYGISPNGMRFFHGDEIGAAARALPPLELTEVALKNELKRLEDAGYDKDALLVVYSHDCVPPEQAMAVIDHMRKWNETHASPRLVPANPEDFFRHMAEEYGDRLRVYRGETRRWFNGPGYDFVPGRRAALDMLEAERYWAWDRILGGKYYPALMFAEELTDLIESAAHGGGTYLASQLQDDYTNFRRNQLNDNIAARAHYLRRTGFATLAQRVRTDGPAIAVYNALSWPRSGVIEIPVLDGLFPQGASLVDSVTGRSVPCEIATHQGDALAGMDPRQVTKKIFLGEAGDKLLRFTAADVPGMGYKLFKVVTGDTPAAATTTRSVAGPLTVESPFYKITVSPAGEIRAFCDKTAKRELMSSEGGHWGEPWVFVNKVKGEHSLLDVRPVRLAVRPATLSLRAGPVEQQIIIERPGDVIPRTEITLPADVPQVRLRHHVDPRALAALDLSRYHKLELRLPLSYNKNTLRTFIQNGDTVRGYNTSELSGDNQDYAYGSVGWGVYIRDTNHGLFISSRELVELPDYSLRRPSEQPILLLSCDAGGPERLGQKTLVDLVFSTDQGQAAGPERDRPADPAEIYRRAWDGALPLRANETHRGPIRDLGFRGKAMEDPQHSLIAIDAPNVVVLALKQARATREGAYTLRVLEIAGAPATRARVRLPDGAARAWRADQTEHALDELKLQDGRIELPLRAHEIATIRFDLP